MAVIANFSRSSEYFRPYLRHGRVIITTLILWFITGNTAMAEEKIMLELENGTVEIETLPDLAPNHVARIKELVAEGFYDGVVFHRVIPGFMAQTGDPTGTGRGGSGQKIDAEFSREPHVRGIVSMARTANPNSADSQFFIVYEDAGHLDGQYTVWGRVVSGMELIEAIPGGTGGNGRVVDDPVKIVRMHNVPPVE